mmetsp:Transcript_27056/g.77641  ORF Transcript_27056/g.77641 Transcript_27056/m.77641 type:complete len:419 (+) Transcript_27056:173-1429(+)
MDEEFSATEWFEGLISALTPDSPPSWSKSIDIGASSVVVAIADHVCVDDLIVDAGLDRLVVRCRDHAEALVIGGVYMEEATAVARWNVKRRTLRIAVKHASVPNLSTLPPSQRLEESDRETAPSSVREAWTSSAAREAAVESSLQDTFASITEFDCCAKRMSALAGKLHNTALALVSQDNSVARSTETAAEKANICDCEPISLEGLTLFEDSSRMYASPAISTGQVWWPAGLAMTRFLREHSHVLPASGPFSVLEIGSGLGLLGMFVAKHWPEASVLLTDVETALPPLARSVATNFSDEEMERVKVQALPWGPVGEAECTAVGAPDVVLGSDVCYRRDLTELVLWTVCRLGAPCALIALADREGSLDSFADSCVRHNITFEERGHFRGSELKREDVLTAQTDIYIYQLFVPSTHSSFH